MCVCRCVFASVSVCVCISLYVTSFIINIFMYSISGSCLLVNSIILISNYTLTSIINITIRKHLGELVPQSTLKSKLKNGQAGLSGAKRGLMVPHDAKQSQMGPNGVKLGKTRPKRALWGKTRPKGPNGPKEVKWGQMWRIFCMHAYFNEIKKSCLATQTLRQKLAELQGFC